MITPPDETYSAAGAGALLGKSERQVLRYLTSGALLGSNASGRWRVPALGLWRFQGIEQEMLALWRGYCRDAERQRQTQSTPDRSEAGMSDSTTKGEA